MARVLAVLFAVIAYTIYHFYSHYTQFNLPQRTPIPQEIFSKYWGPGEAKRDDETVHPMKIEVSDNALTDLKERLQRSRFTDYSVEDSQFHYGFPVEELRKLNEYWLKKYDWRKHEKIINSKSHYRTQIDGLQVHFVRSTSDPKKYKKIVPLLMLHGWPSSVWDFYKALSMLTDPVGAGITQSYEIGFDVVAPSLPGFGWSEGSHKKGFSTIAAAVSLGKLMRRLGFNRYILHGGDWGGSIGAELTKIWEENVIGFHSLQCFVFPNGKQLFRLLLGALAPNYFFSKIDVERTYPLGEQFMKFVQETGYFHIHATKPDTVGGACSLGFHSSSVLPQKLGAPMTDSPIGLAAYLLEKYSTGANPDYRGLSDGGLTKHWTLDELLTQVMIYWTTNSAVTSNRYYKDSFSQDHRDTIIAGNDIFVPTACLMSKQDTLFQLPRPITELKYRNITQYTNADKAGHFFAFEEPKVLSSDIYKFVSSFL